MTAHEGHRHRLRQRFLTGPETLSDAQLLELLLAYAIPRRDVAPLAARLIEVYGSLERLLAAPYAELARQEGVGEATAVLLAAAQELRRRANQAGDSAVAPQDPSSHKTASMNPQQQPLFSPSPHSEGKPGPSPKPPPPPPMKSGIRTYNNDLTRVALVHLPEAVNYSDIAGFLSYLEENLPYNSGITRTRYSRYLTNRFFPDGTIDTPLTQVLSHAPDPATWPTTWKEILFLETVKAEPAVQFVAEEVIWPALTIGHLERKALSERLRKRFAEAGDATIKRMTYSVINLYTLLDVATLEGDRLVFRNRAGTLSAFAYGLAAEFPEPGIYTFAALENGPLRRWLLWDKEWMRRQLYNLRDLGVAAKVSEIDAVRQFTLSTDQRATLSHYFEHSQRETLALRESSPSRGDAS